MNYILIILLTIVILFLYLYRHQISRELSTIENKSPTTKPAPITFHNYLLYYDKAIEIYERNEKVVMSSKGETATKHAIESILFAATEREYKFEKIKHDEIINPNTGKKLEIDCFNQELKLALEYNGQQHYLYTPHFHRSEDDYNKQLFRDQIKRKRCKELGIVLIEVPHIIKEKDILLYICMKLNECGFGV